MVSMAWAGRRSENLASVWLLYHLFDKISFSEFWQIAQRLNMAPESKASAARDESQNKISYAKYVRDTLGLILTRGRYREVRFEKAVQSRQVDLIFEGLESEAMRLVTLPYGLGFAKEIGKQKKKRGKESKERLAILSRNFYT